VVGVMDLATMALVTAAISAERLLPPRSHATRAVGAVLLLWGSWMLVSALTGSG
jgi:predicted metal-binding membrane protein